MFEHWIEWYWDSGYITTLSSGMGGEGYQTGAVKWEYCPGESEYYDNWSPYDIWYERTSIGHFKYYIWLGWWINTSDFDKME